MDDKNNSPCTLAATITDPEFAAVYRVLEDAIAAGAFPGCAFGVLADGKVLLQDALRPIYL